MGCLNSIQFQEYSAYMENIFIRLLLSVTQKDKNNYESVHVTHSHNSSELFVCSQGEVVIKTKNGYINLSEGDSAIIPPGITHVKYPTADNTVNYVLSFSCTRTNHRYCTDIYKQFLPFVSGNKIIIFRNQPSLVNWAENINNNINSEDNFLPVLNMVNLLLLASKIPFETEENESTSHSPNANLKSIDRGYQLDHLISIYFNKKFVANEIAQQLHICSRQLDRIVRQRYGKSLHAVIMEKRIKTAEQLLLTTDKTNEQIATALGFSSASGFYREFFRQHRLTPNEFRKNRPDNDH